MQNDLQMWNFWLGEGRYTITISGIPTGVENMKGALQNLLGGLSQYNSILKISVKSLKKHVKEFICWSCWLSACKPAILLKMDFFTHIFQGF